MTDDGWIEWKGGECPVPNKTHVEVVLRNDDRNETRAETLDWLHLNEPDDIIAYRKIREVRP